jgi:ParB family transcriptional regulator, chromosome partitioning protein
MPNPTGPSASGGKKARLGRGLGSLLGGAPDLGAESPAETKPPESSAKTPSAQGNNQTAKIQPAAGAEANAPLAGLTSQKTNTQAAMGTQTQTSMTTQAVAAAPVPQKPIDEEAQIWKIPIDRLVPNTQQPRQVFTPEALRDLTASIKEHGILQPITARRLSERQFEIIAGERRWRAAQSAGLHQVPVILKNVSEQISLELAIIENIQRENLNPMDEAEAIDQLAQTYKLTQQQVADKLGKDRSSVANAIRLLTLPRDLREMVRTTELSAGHAKVLLGVEDFGTQVTLAKKVIAEKLSVRATEKLVAAAKIEARSGDETKKGGMNVDVSKRLIDGLSTELQKLVGTKVAIDYAGGKGKMTVHFYSDDQLTAIVEKFRKSWEK